MEEPHRAFSLANNDKLNDELDYLNNWYDDDTRSYRAEVFNEIEVSSELHTMTDRERMVCRWIALLNAMGGVYERFYTGFRASMAYNNGKCLVRWIGPKEDGNFAMAKQQREAQRALQFYKEKGFFKSREEAVQSAIGLFLDAAKKDDPIGHCVAAFLHGGNSWMTENDLDLAPDLQAYADDTALFLGRLDDDFVYYRGEQSLITIAPPGAGKTRCHVLPNLKSFMGGAIVLDIKGECAEETAAWRHENVGPVKLFAPSHPDQSHKFNPLSFLPQDVDKVWDEARFLTNLLIVPTSLNEPVWENQGRDFLTLIICYVNFLPEDQRNMARVLYYVNDVGLNELLEKVIGHPNFAEAMQRIATRFRNMRKDAERQFQGVLSGAAQHLSVWEGTNVSRVTSSTDWSPLDFRKSSPLTLYLVVKPNEIESFAPLLRVIIALHVRMLIENNPSDDASKVLFMLDELPRLGRMEPIREALEVGRSYKLQLWMFCQYLGQLNATYGQDIAEGLVSSCGAEMYMNPDAKTAATLSKKLGHKQGLLDNDRKPLVEATDLTGPDYRNKIISLIQSERPCLLDKTMNHF